jgi:hypothetical protein
MEAGAATPAFTFNQWLALVLTVGGFIVMLTGAYMVMKTRRLAARATEEVRQALAETTQAASQLRMAAAGNADPASVAAAEEKVAETSAKLRDVKDLLETLPKEERFPGLMLFAGIATVFLALVAAGVVQLTAPAAG